MEKLDSKQKIIIEPTVPFDFNSTFHKPDHFPSGDNEWEQGIRWQTMLWKDKRLGLKFIDKENTNIAVKVFSSSELSQDFIKSLKKELMYRYCLDLDLKEFNEEFENHSLLGPIIEKWKGMRPIHSGSLYEYTVIMIMLQNCTVKRSVNMLQRLFENYGVKLSYDDKELWSYWEPEDLEKVTGEELRELKLGYRAKFLDRISKQFAQGKVDEFKLREKPREEQKEALLKLYGIGPASVGNLLWEVFRNYSKIEHISPWERKIYSKLFFDREPDNPASEESLLSYFEEEFGKYQMLAVHYIWEDLWWKRKNKDIAWLEELINL